MQCPICGGANVDGAKFCGVCGQRLAEGPPTVPPGMQSPLAQRVTAETRSMEGQPPRPQPYGGSSLGESLRVPASQGARGVKIALILALDVGLAIGGIVLMTRGGGGEADAAGNVAVVQDGGGGGFIDRDAAAVGEPSGPSGPRGGGTSGGSGGGGGGTSGTGGTGGTGGSPGTGIGPGGTGSTDAAAAAAPALDGGTTTTPPPTPDAGAEPAIVVDAAPAPVTVDAAEAEPVAVDAAADLTDAPEAAVSFDEIRRHLARLVAAGSGRRDRCYQNATKALPADQPLSGEVDIGLSVMPTGAVQNVRVARNTTGSNDLGACILAGAEDWTFPPHNEGEPVQLEQRFRFGGAQ